MSTASATPATSRVGRPRRLDDAKRREICALVSAGCGITGAAQYVHCAPATIHKERKRNPEFRDQLHRAELAAQMNPLCAMQQAVRTHSRAAAWMFERVQPERFGRQRPTVFGHKQLQALVDEITNIIRDEVLHDPTRDRLERRIIAAMRYAMYAAWETSPVGHELRKAMEYFEQKDRNRSASYCRFDEMDFTPFMPKRHPESTATPTPSHSTAPQPTPKPVSAPSRHLPAEFGMIADELSKTLKKFSAPSTPGQTSTTNHSPQPQKT